MRDEDIVGRMVHAYLCAIAELERRSPDEIRKCKDSAHDVIEKIRVALDLEEAKIDWPDLTLAFVGFLVAIADEADESNRVGAVQ